MIGSTVSHYKILEKLGGGGMGIVYKAQDLKLDRLVALKFLPPDLTRDPDAKERFVHEAKAASALQHNNICTVHEIDESEDGRMFMVMDLYEGETLKKKIEHGRVKIEDALDIATQVAQGLAKAHEQGIVHRDIKPANIVVTKDGVAKIVDFGLAKLSGVTKLTRTGSTVGTIAYMPPEQLQGAPVDARADIFSFGVVLYEMLAGVTPFRGEHEAALVYSILNVEPEPLQVNVPAIPSELLHIVSRALEKDPKDRYQTMADVVIDLRRVKKETADVTPRTAGMVSRYQKRRRRMFVLGTGSVILALAAGIVFLLPRHQVIKINPKATTRVLCYQTFQADDNLFGAYCMPGISADGNWVSYGAPDDSGNWNLYFMNIAWSEPRKIELPQTGPYRADLNAARISPHGESIALNAGGLVSVMPTSGGTVRSIVRRAWLQHWTPDGSRIGYILPMRPEPPFAEFWSIKPDGTDNRLDFADSLTVRASIALAASWSPDARSIAWIRDFQGDYSELFTRELQSGRERQLTFDKAVADEPFWLSNGIILFASTRSGKWSLWAVPESGGEPVQLTLSGGENRGVSSTADGRRVLVPEMDSRADLWVSDISGGREDRVKLDFPVSRPSCALNWDFSAMAYTVEEKAEPGCELWIAGSDGSNRRKVCQLPTRSLWLGWSPDGRWIRCYQRTSGWSVDVLVVEVTNPNRPRLVCTSAMRAYWTDHNRLAVLSTDLKTIIYSMDGSAPQPFFEDSTYARPIADGQYVVYEDFRKGHEGGWMTQITSNGRPVGKPRRLPPSAKDFSPDLRTWLYEKKPGEIWRLTLPEWREEYLRPVGRIRNPYISGDGKRIAYLMHNATMKLSLIENVFE